MALTSTLQQDGSCAAALPRDVPNSASFVKMSEASVEHFRRRLALAWEEERNNGSSVGRGQKRRRGSQSSEVKLSRGQDNPPEVVMNDMNPSGQQHLSLSKTVVLRSHEIEPFAQAMREAVKSSRRFTLSVVGGYDVLVNEEKTRSFVCLRVRGGRSMVLQLIAKVDPVMQEFKKPQYYKDPIVHVSVASVPGDISDLVGSSSEERSSEAAAAAVMRKAGSRTIENGVDCGESDSEEGDDDVPCEVCVDVKSVTFKAGTSVKEAPLLSV